MILEICCYNLESAINAQNGGADRIELCEDPIVGGITPSIELFKEVKKNISIPVFVMIRPKGGNFIYSENEFLQIKNKIIQFKNLEANGFVFGILNKNNEVDIKRNSELVKLASPIPCTFHKAFDETKNPFIALENIIFCGFSRILTSGQKAKTIEGVSLISELISKAENKICIMPGGGIRSSNITKIRNKTNSKELHSSGIIDNSRTSDLEEIKFMKRNIQN